MCHPVLRDRLGCAGVTVLLLLFIAAQPASGQGRLYWVEPDNSVIKTSDFDGSGVHTIAKGYHIGQPLEIDIDQQTGWMYWTDQGSYRIFRASPDGREGEEIVPEAISPYGIAVDGVNGFVYWTERDAIRRANLDGTNVTDLVTSFEWPEALEISVDDDLMFWSDGGIHRSTLNGSGLQQISTARPEYMAVDEVHKKIYYSLDSLIVQMEFDGTQVDTVIKSSDHIAALAVEPAAIRLCWAQRESVPIGGTIDTSEIICASIDGFQGVKLTDVPGFPQGLAINYESRMIYMTTALNYQRVMRCQADGSGLEDLVLPIHQPIDVAVDPEAGQIYWVDEHRFPQMVAYSNLEGRNVQELPVAVGSPAMGASSAVALDLVNRTVYAAFAGGGSFTPGGIVMGPIGGPIDNILSTDYGRSVTDVEVDATHGKLYYVLEGELWTRNLDGSNPTQLLLSVGAGIAVTDQYLYWLHLGSQTLRRSDLDGTNPVDLLSGVTPINDLIVDASGRYLWWSSRADNAVMRFEIGDVAAQQIISPSTRIGGLAVVSPPSSVSLISPVQGAEGLPTTLTLSWSWPPDAQRFDVQITSGDNISEIVLALNTPLNEATFVAPVAESSYYWRVRPTGGGGYGGWTNTNRFTVGASGALAPTLLEPSDGETNVAVDPTFQWVQAPEADYHRLQVSENPSFDPPLLDVGDLVGGSYQGGPLENERMYFWRVAGFSDDGQYTYSATKHFTTVIAAPEAVSLVAPEAAATGVSALATFSWQALADADSYLLEVASDSLFTQIAAAIEGSDTTHTLGSPLANDARYFWRVRGINAGGDGAWSEIRSFTTVLATPAAVTLVTPAASAADVPAYALFTWQASEDADSYRLEVASDSLFTQMVTAYEGTETSHTVESPLAYDTKFFWRVRGKNQAGDGAWSEVRSFRTVVGTRTEDDAVPARFALYQNYPNPFGRSTQIRYDLPKAARVSLVVFDAVGREVEQLVDENQPPGGHVVSFNANGRPGGLYVYRLQAGEYERERSMVIVR